MLCFYLCLSYSIISFELCSVKGLMLQWTPEWRTSELGLYFFHGKIVVGSYSSHFYFLLSYKMAILFLYSSLMSTTFVRSVVLQQPYVCVSLMMSDTFCVSVSCWLFREASVCICLLERGSVFFPSNGTNYIFV